MIQFKPNTFYSDDCHKRVYTMVMPFVSLPKGAGYTPFSDVKWLENNMPSATLTYPL